MTESMTYHSGPDPWNPPAARQRPIVIRKRWRNWHRPRWEVRIYGTVYATFSTGAGALDVMHHVLAEAERSAAADTTAHTHAHPEDPT